jgi:hypothetical protein
MRELALRTGQKEIVKRNESFLLSLVGIDEDRRQAFSISCQFPELVSWEIKANS